MDNWPTNDLEYGLSKEELNALPHELYTGEIVIIDTLEALDKAVARLRQSRYLGFDTETRPSFKKGVRYKVSLLQLSDGAICYLIRLNKIGIPSSLRELLADPTIMKIGLSLKDDFSSLRHLDDTLEFGSFLEMQTLAKSYHIKNISLSGLYGVLFGKRLSKAQRLSNWEAEPLSKAQQEYAALDALATLRVYQQIRQQ